jgi:hypothetical protein
LFFFFFFFCLSDLALLVYIIASGDRVDAPSSSSSISERVPLLLLLSNAVGDAPAVAARMVQSASVAAPRGGRRPASLRTTSEIYCLPPWRRKGSIQGLHPRAPSNLLACGNSVASGDRVNAPPSSSNSMLRGSARAPHFLIAAGRNDDCTKYGCHLQISFV